MNRNKESRFQVEDDYNLLSKMMEDCKVANDLYKPTNYWFHYQKKFLPELMKKGLKNFRRREYSILTSFGATDIKIKGRIIQKKNIKGLGLIARLLSNYLNNTKFISLGLNNSIGSGPSDVCDYFYHYVKKKFDKIGFDISNCSMSLFGNPDDVSKINGNYWSTVHLLYGSMFADVIKEIYLKNPPKLVELGAGLGRNVEIFAKIYDKATLIIFDIPPQLYVSNQFLVKVFGERVIPYKDAIKLKVNNNNRFQKLIEGKIIILPTWKMPEWKSIKIDIFWNSASFQEMEPHIVINYIKLVKEMKPEWIYINALEKGNYWGKWKPGRGGTKKPVLAKYYFEELNDIYTLHKEFYTDNFLRKKEYTSWIFKMKK